MKFLAVFLLLAAAADPGGTEGVLDAGVDAWPTFDDAGTGDAGGDGATDEETDDEADDDSHDHDHAPGPARAAPVDDWTGDRIAWIQVVIDAPRQGEEAQLLRFLTGFIGKPARPDTSRAVEDFLLSIGRYKAAVCRLWSKPQYRGRLKCGLSRARTIRRIRIEGLPLQMLETDLRKRIFLRPGEVLDKQDIAGRDRVARQRERVQEYLEREGYFGAEVDVLTPPVSDTRDVDVLVRIIGGNFVQVRNVDVKAHAPLSKSDLSVFGRMCLSTEGWLSGFETFQIACYTRERLRETIERVESGLRRRGYPEARVRVIPRPVPPDDKDAGFGCGWKKSDVAAFEDDEEPVPPRCLDLEVTVTPGPHLRARIEAVEGADVEDDPLRRVRLFEWAQPTWELLVSGLRTARRVLVEPASRAVQVLSGTDVEVADDSTVHLIDLYDVLTFEEARSTDRSEAEATRLAIERALQERGHLLARVEMKYEEKDRDHIEVVYRVWPGPTNAVAEIVISGNIEVTTEQLLKEVELAASERTPLKGGFVTKKQLNDDVERLLTFYDQLGFPEADVGFELVRSPGGATAVHFRIDEGPRFVLAKLIIDGGDPALVAEVLRNIAHCRRGKAFKEERSPTKPADCAGSPFLPDEFEADEKRVLNIYVTRGYPYAFVQVMPDFAAEGAVVRIVIRSDRDGSGEQQVRRVQRGEIFVDGNEVTLDSVMLREMDIDDGPLRPLAIAEGVTKLRRTGLYSRVHLEYVGIEEKSDTVHLRLQVEERPAISWDASAAFSTDRLWSVRNELHNRNLFGTMFDITFLADVGLFIGRYSILQNQVRWPRMFGVPVSLQFTPAVSYEDRPGVSTPRRPAGSGPTTAEATWFTQDLRHRTLKLLNTISLEWQPFKEITIGADYGFEVSWDDGLARRIQPFTFEQLRTMDGLLDVVRTKDPTQLSTIAPRVAWRRLDNPFDPTAGGLVEASLKMGSPYILNQDWMALARLRGAYYVSFLSRFTLATHARGWVGGSYTTKLYDSEGNERNPKPTLLIDQDVLALGGDRTIRGYDQDSIGVVWLVQDAEQGIDVTDDGRLLLSGAVANIELRYTLIRNLFIGDLKLATFIDAGYVAHNDPNLLVPDAASIASQLIDPQDDIGRQSRVGASVGAGVRYVLPVGPASVDCAVSPLPGPAAQPIRAKCHLQLGYAF